MLEERNNHFKPIPGFPDYLIHCSGKIIFLPTNKVINQKKFLTSREIALVKDENIFIVNLHRLLLKAFHVRFSMKQRTLYGRMI